MQRSAARVGAVRAGRAPTRITLDEALLVATAGAVAWVLAKNTAATGRVLAEAGELDLHPGANDGLGITAAVLAPSAWCLSPRDMRPLAAAHVGFPAYAPAEPERPPRRWTLARRPRKSGLSCPDPGGLRWCWRSRLTEASD
jgi:hypothetical protein